MVEMKWWRSLALCVLGLGVAASAVAVPASAEYEELVPAPPAAQGVWTGMNGPGLSMGAAEPAAAAECIGRSGNPFLASLGAPAGINTGVAARVNTDCNSPVNRIITTVQLWRYFGPHGGWAVIDAKTQDSGVWPTIKHGLAKVKKACYKFQGAWYQTVGIHKIYYRGGGIGQGKSGSPVTRLGCLA